MPKAADKEINAKKNPAGEHASGAFTLQPVPSGPAGGGEDMFRVALGSDHGLETASSTHLDYFQFSVP